MNKDNSAEKFNEKGIEMWLDLESVTEVIMVLRVGLSNQVVADSHPIIYQHVLKIVDSLETTLLKANPDLLAALLKLKT